MNKQYKVAGYVKNALLWKKRNPEEMIAYNRAYFEKQIEGADNMELVDVYVDVTGNKETYKRPEMVRLIRDVVIGKINLIYARTSGYIAANANELCMLMEFLFEQEQMVGLYTEDPVYQFDTICMPAILGKHTVIILLENNLHYSRIFLLIKSKEFQYHRMGWLHIQNCIWMQPKKAKMTLTSIKMHC